MCSALGMDKVSCKWLVERKGRAEPSAPPLSALLTTPRTSKATKQTVPVADGAAGADELGADDDDEEDYCFCGTARHRRSNTLPFEGVWVGCDRCGRWCHGECAGVTDMQAAAALQDYTCLPCLTPKDPIEAFDRQRNAWCPASIKAVDPDDLLALCEAATSAGGSPAPVPTPGGGPSFSYKVHYKGWSEKWDEWVTYERLRPPREGTRDDEDKRRPPPSAKEARKGTGGKSAGKSAAGSVRSKKAHATKPSAQAEGAGVAAADGEASTSGLMATEPQQAGEPTAGVAAGSAEEELAGILSDALGSIGPVNAEALVEALKARGMFS